MLTRGFRIGRLFGIDIRLDWSWALIFLLLTWNLVAVFARWHPDWSPVETALVAALASIIFFACVLLHELAHSAVATGFGMRVRGITLFLFGGVSNIEREPPTAKAELFIAIVGPLTSVVLGVIFLVLAGASVHGIDFSQSPRAIVGSLGPATTLLLWLGPMNVFVGLFNCIPAFPLDGGRVLRAILWLVTGSLRKATRAASFVGQLVAWAFVGLGVAMTFGLRIPFFGTGFIGGLWLAAIGWFLHGAALASYRGLVVREALEGIPVSRVMRTNVPFIEGSLPVSSLVHMLVTGPDRVLPVVRGEDLIGFAGLADVRRIDRDRWEATPVSSIATPLAEWTTFAPSDDLAAAFDRLVRRGVEQAPVMQDGRVVGMLFVQDVARWLEMQSDPGLRFSRA